MVEVLERGDIYFLYRPKVERELGEVGGMDDVQRFFAVLRPDNKELYRLLVIGQKQLPDIQAPQDRARRSWAFVDKVTARPEDFQEAFARHTYETKTRGERLQPGARPAGEGVYAVVAHGEGGSRHTHLAYALELPRRAGEVQQELNLPEEGSYVISVKNPDAGSPPAAGLRREQKAELPQPLRERFRGRRFAELEPPDFLDHEGTELVLVGAHDDPSEELGIALDPEEETRRSADLCKDLRMDCGTRRARPLFTGEWV